MSKIQPVYRDKIWVMSSYGLDLNSSSAVAIYENIGKQLPSSVPQFPSRVKEDNDSAFHRVTNWMGSFMKSVSQSGS